MTSLCRVCDPIAGTPRAADDEPSSGACERCGATLDVPLTSGDTRRTVDEL